jgi:hypothetical protein
LMHKPISPEKLRGYLGRVAGQAKLR